MWASDPGCEPIIIDKVETKLFCSNCKREMLKHNNTFECPTCRSTYREEITH